MRELQLKQTNTKIPSIAVGCMRIDSMEIPALAQHIEFCEIGRASCRERV